MMTPNGVSNIQLKVYNSSGTRSHHILQRQRVTYDGRTKQRQVTVAILCANHFRLGIFLGNSACFSASQLVYITNEYSRKTPERRHPQDEVNFALSNATHTDWSFIN